jgi:hypothetical protein
MRSKEARKGVPYNSRSTHWPMQVSFHHRKVAQLPRRLKCRTHDRFTLNHGGGVPPTRANARFYHRNATDLFECGSSFVRRTD